MNDYKYWRGVSKRNGIENKVFYNRVKYYNWDLERAATEPVKSRKDKKWLKVANFNGIRRETFYYRVDEMLWTPEEAATIPPMTKEESMQNAHEILKEHREIENDRLFKDESNIFRPTPKHFQLAKQNGIGRNLVRSRIYGLGWTVQEAITTPSRTNPDQPEGFEKYKEIAKGNGIKYDTFKRRLDRGWSMERASTETPIQPNQRTRKDAHWIDKAVENGISDSLYRARRYNGWSPEEASSIEPLPSGQYLNEERKQNSADGFKKFTRV